VHNITGGSWWCGKHVSALDTAVGADAIYLEGAAGVKITKCWIASGDGLSSGGTGGRSLITIDGTNQTTDYLTVRDITGENLATLPAYGIRVANGTRTHTLWDIRQIRLPVATSLMHTDNTNTLDAMCLAQVGDPSAVGINLANVQNSEFHGANLIMHLRGTSSHNLYVYNDGNLTIDDTKTGDIYLDVKRGGTYRRTSQGTTPTAGLVTLVAGTKTVANTAVTTNSYFKLQRVSAGGAIGDLTFTKSAGVSFTINSASATDTSVVFWELTELY
jgi:hypothetical protein